VAGAEGGVWLAIEGDEAQLARVETLVRDIFAEPRFELE
jgi:hypothetical protein